MGKLAWKQITSEERIPGKKNLDAKQWRSEIESDYLRIVRSASFRRLQDKTQVFPLDKSDFVRTRLTHSYEVSSIAKFIGKQVCSRIEKEKMEEEDDLPNALNVNEILNCAGLLHDIGNPPFGHFGETAIRDWFSQQLSKKQLKGKMLRAWLSEQQAADLENFEGNAQALRITSKLHRLIGNNGMHLTSGVLDTIIKYPCDSITMLKNKEKKKEERNLLHKKIGYFQSEEALYQAIKENTKTMNCRNPLTFILEAADDLAYTFADLEDGFNKNLYTYDELLETITKANDTRGIENLKKNLEDGMAMQKYREDGFNPYQHAIFTWLTVKQLFCISKVSDAFLQNYESIMDGTFHKELIAVSTEGEVIHQLKDFAYRKIYNDSSILKLELMGNEILSFLLDRFVDAVIVYDTDEKMKEIQSKYIDLLSRNYLDNYHKSVKGMNDEGERLYHRLLLAADFIAGMTDSYAKRLYQELKGI